MEDRGGGRRGVVSLASQQRLAGKKRWRRTEMGNGANEIDVCRQITRNVFLLWISSWLAMWGV